MEIKKPFAIYTVNETTYSEENNGVLKQYPKILLRVHRVFGIPIKRTYAEQIKLHKIPTSSTS